MTRLLLGIAIVAMAGLNSGCAMCSAEGDYNYGFFGGSWQRMDPCRGRVGSAFYEAGAPVKPAEPEVIETPEPTPTDEPAPRIPLDEMTEPTQHSPTRSRTPRS